VDQFEALGGEVGFLSDPTEPLSPGDRTKLTRAATAFGMTIVEVEFSSESELDSAVAKLVGQRVDVIYAGATIAANMRGRLIELANRSRLPVVGAGLMFEAGGLFAYTAFIGGVAAGLVAVRLVHAR